MQNIQDHDEKAAWIKRAGLKSWLKHEKKRRELEEKHKELEKKHRESKAIYTQYDHTGNEKTALVEHVEHVAVSHSLKDILKCQKISLKDILKRQKKIFDKHYKIIINEKYCKEELPELSDEEKKVLAQKYLSELSIEEKDKLYEKICMILNEKLDYLLNELEIK